MTVDVSVVEPPPVERRVTIEMSDGDAYRLRLLISNVSPNTPRDLALRDDLCAAIEQELEL